MRAPSAGAPGSRFASSSSGSLVALVFWAVVALLPGFDVPSFGAVLLTTALIAAINALLWPLVIRVVLPLDRVQLRPRLVGAERGGGLDRGRRRRWIGAAVPRRARRRLPALRRACCCSHPRSASTTTRASCGSSAAEPAGYREANRTDVPGVILFEIDGLAEPVLRRALSDGHAPTMARWIEDGTHRIVPWECDLSSQTGASQAGLLLGSNHDMPAFRWYEKESGRHDGLEPRQGRGGARAPPLRRRRPARGGRGQPREHVLGRRAALLGDDERDQGPEALQGERVLRLLRRSLRLHPHDRPLPLGRRSWRCGQRAGSASTARTMSTAEGSTR